jgi:hypothetical protein
MPDAVDPAETIHHKTHRGHKGSTVTELTRLLLGGFVRCVRLRGDGPPRTIRIREKINCNAWAQWAPFDTGRARARSLDAGGRPDVPPTLGSMPQARCATSSSAGWSAGPSWRMTRTGRRSSRAWAPPPDRHPARRPALPRNPVGPLHGGDRAAPRGLHVGGAQGRRAGGSGLSPMSQRRPEFPGSTTSRISRREFAPVRARVGYSP